MGYGQVGVLCYIDESGNRVVVSAENPLPSNATRVFISKIVSK